MDYHILYVDDEEDNLASFKAVFRRRYKIHLANSGQEALDFLQKQSVQLIISDQRMPKMEGTQLLSIVREKYPDIIRMILTGYSDMKATIDAINKGNIYYYISKPWKAEEMQIILDRALETYSLRIKNRDLEKANVLAQFDILKSQINPHFLFNSMNVLAAIIPNDPQKAVKYTKGFAKLYRAVLQLKEQLIISVEEEMTFIENYFALQQVRFEDSLQLEIDIMPAHLSWSIPPFALQILLENAIKHNIISEAKPLKISIQSDQDRLVIRNNYQVRGEQVASAGVGLQNLVERYKILGIDSISSGIQGQEFIVSIPLIPNG